MTLTVLSLGAGVQSTTLALMAAHGDLPAPDYAIFADTGWEPANVYDHLRWLMSPNVLPFPVHIVTHGNLRDDTIAKHSTRSGRFAAVPWYTKTIQPNGSWKPGMGKRQCTAHYKLEPIAKELRRLLGKGPHSYIAPGSVEIWIGISTDEAARQKAPRQKYQRGRWPLLDMKKSRRDCYDWLESRDYPVVRPEDAHPEDGIFTWPPKSACEGCPFLDEGRWLETKTYRPETFADLVMIDHTLRDGGTARGIRAEQYMHRSMVPLDQVVFKPKERAPDLFQNECTGMCGN